MDVTQPIDQQAAQLQEARAVIATPLPSRSRLALKCPNLRLVQTVSAGTNLIDIAALNGRLNIKVAEQWWR